MPIRIGFIGAGSAARRHCEALARLENAQIVAFCDIAARRAQEMAEFYDAAPYSSLPRMLARENLDALYVCTPPHAHGAYEIAAIKAGCALFIEPPIANNLRTAQSVLKALGKSGGLCSVGHFWRYAEATTRLRKEIGGRNAPQPLLLSGKWLAPPPATAWRRDLKSSGGIWLDDAYQLLDLTRLFGGEAKKVSAFAASLEIKNEFPEATTPDVCAAILELQSGALASFGAATMTESESQSKFSLSTREAQFFLRGNRLKITRGEEETHFKGADDAILAQNAAFLRAVESGKRTEIRTTYADAVKTLRLALALNRASLGSKTVTLAP
ncbi:MAG: Gfo/Idh/MocA family oxidoreductase [Armatimonadetes bacterium]|nr:Gfo/Idh/MocA family oxidoreductase [Armatimonadota bacterium]